MRVHEANVRISALEAESKYGHKFLIFFENYHFDKNNAEGALFERVFPFGNCVVSVLNGLSPFETFERDSHSLYNGPLERVMVSSCNADE